MRFFSILDELKQFYDNDIIVRKNGTMLLHPGKIPNSRHMLYKPLNDEYIEDYLVSQYANTFPKEYIKFLKYSNGADLCSVKLNTQGVSFACPMFTILGLPLTPPFNRPSDMEEPFDMRVEDLARHDDIPNTWLKCGTYLYDTDFNTDYDIFIDTENGRVYSCIRRQKEIVEQWDTLDECFCSIWDSLKNCKEEYDD